MRKFAIALALAATALSGAASAKDKAWYIGLEAGVNLLQKQRLDIKTANGATTVNEAITHTYFPGFDVGGNIGYDFGGFRAEFALNYLRDRNRESTVLNVPPPIPYTLADGTNTVGGPAPGNYPNAGGTASALAFMVNGLVDFGGKGNDVGGYFGAGAGIARVKQFARLRDPGQVFQDDADTAFAWNLLAGVYKPISDHVDIGLKYRWMNVSAVNTFSVNGLPISEKFRSHSLLLTLTYNFFEPAPPPPPRRRRRPLRLRRPRRRRRCRRARLRLRPRVRSWSSSIGTSRPSRLKLPRSWTALPSNTPRRARPALRLPATPTSRARTPTT
jgi:opacity protein-like surface antigen